ncbi:hypothetical protein BAUCODRAFT_467712 [Baudoinia panamericana UAMH 10762]|uniref:Uncharacterized protein n=1 Tax=Baudoinia panamericana (strain UAMH 10762) TaxID=717646 RepID=M2NBG5_BAUPA|nr:uncharacterized protein BAUCODRAFT_467712 [Baudoinia panamericana UAMH 10762]EMC96240.1 hypothetical protein BAUCODRAFT_467712 [Baudoinia panamericana UAMH 10762]
MAVKVNAFPVRPVRESVLAKVFSKPGTKSSNKGAPAVVVVETNPVSVVSRRSSLHHYSTRLANLLSDFVAYADQSEELFFDIPRAISMRAKRHLDPENQDARTFSQLANNNGRRGIAASIEAALECTTGTRQAAPRSPSSTLSSMLSHSPVQ